MDRKRYLVLIIEHKEESQKTVADLLEDMRRQIDPKYGKIRLVYEGSDNKIVTALERVLGLTK